MSTHNICFCGELRDNIYELVHEKTVLITLATSKDSDKPVHNHSLPTAFAVCKGVVGALRKLQAKIPVFGPIKGLHISIYRITNRTPLSALF